MRIREIKPGIFVCLMDNRTANAGFVVTEHGVMVIDTLEKPESGHMLAAAIKEHTGQPVYMVINTHYHFDHTFGNQAFDAPIVGHCTLSEGLAKAEAQSLMPVAVAAWISEHPEDRWLADELELVYPNVVFEGSRLVFDFAPYRLVLRHLGGHTPDSTIVELPDAGVVFTGDLVFEGRVPYLREANFADTIKALRIIEELGAGTIVPGHGELCDMEHVTRMADYVESLRDVVADLIKRGVEKADILDHRELPYYWTEDRVDLLRANVERVYNELKPED